MGKPLTKIQNKRNQLIGTQEGKIVTISNIATIFYKFPQVLKK